MVILQEPTNLEEYLITINKTKNEVIMNERTLVRLIYNNEVDFVMQEDQSFLLFYKGYAVYLIKKQTQLNVYA